MPQKQKKRLSGKSTCRICGQVVKNIARHQAKAHSFVQGMTPVPKLKASPRQKKVMPAIPTNRRTGPVGFGGKRTGLYMDPMSDLAGNINQTARWVARALHPMDETQTSGLRIPDRTDSATIALETRYRGILRPPTGLAAGDTWDAMYIILPLPGSPFITLARKSGTAWPNFSDATVASGVATCHFFATFPPTLYNDTTTGDNGGVSSLAALSENARGTYKGVTIELIANALSNQGQVYAAQWLQEPAMKEDTLMEAAGRDVTPMVSQVYERLPYNPNQMYQKIPNCIDHSAKLGIYMPMRFSQSTHDLKPTPDRSYRTLWDFSTPVSGTGSNFVGAVGLNTAEPTKFVPACTDPSFNFNVGLILFEGMSPQASLEHQCRQGVQAVPITASPWEPFTEASPPNDQRALDAVCDVQRECRLAYPSSYNSFGALWGVVGPLLKKAAFAVLPDALAAVGSWLGFGGKKATPRQTMDIELD